MATTIMELGGNTARLQKVIELAAQYPDASIVISSEGQPEQVIATLDAAGIPRSRWTLDYTAWDTITNFTCTLPLLRKLNTDKVLVVTDGFHMRRAMCIATAVYFRNGIKPVPQPSSPVDHHENPLDVLGETIVAWIWRLTGQLIVTLQLYNDRVGALQNDYYVARTLL